MKVVLIAPRFHTNQIELVDYLLSCGMQVEFWVTGIGASEDHDLVRPRLIALSDLFDRKRRNPSKLSALEAYTRRLPKFSEFRKLMRDDVDLLIVRNPFSSVGFCLSLAARLKRSPILFYTQREQHRPPNRRDKIARLIMRLLNADWMTPCKGNPKDPKPIKEMMYVPFCIKAAAYKKIWFREDRVNLVTVGKFLPRKNHLLLMKAVKSLSSEFRVSLTIIGEVSDVTEESIFKAVQEEANIAPYPVSIHTNLPRAQVFKLYEQSDIFVLPSRDEPASVSNLEAMAHGLPILTSSTNKTSCYTNGNGFIFESDCLNDLRDKLKKMIANRDEIIGMGRKSLELVSTNHASTKVYSAMLRDVGLM